MTDSTPKPERRSVGSALAVYTEIAPLVMIALGFAAALPYFLIFDTLSAWCRATSLPLEVIGFFSLVTLVCQAIVMLGSLAKVILSAQGAPIWHDPVRRRV